MNCMIDNNKHYKFGFLSLGLIGGSIALAIRQIYSNAEIIAYARRQSTLDEAITAGAINIGTTEINELFSDCDITSVIIVFSERNGLSCSRNWLFMATGPHKNMMSQSEKSSFISVVPILIAPARCCSCKSST